MTPRPREAVRRHAYSTISGGMTGYWISGAFVCVFVAALFGVLTSPCQCIEYGDYSDSFCRVGSTQWDPSIIPIPSRLFS